jgi:hypothetical protein
MRLVTAPDNVLFRHSHSKTRDSGGRKAQCTAARFLTSPKASIVHKDPNELEEISTDKLNFLEIKNNTKRLRAFQEKRDRRIHRDGR